MTCFEDAEKADMQKFGRWHRGMLERGVYLAPSAYEVPAPARSDAGKSAQFICLETKSALRSTSGFACICLALRCPPCLLKC